MAPCRSPSRTRAAAMFRQAGRSTASRGARGRPSRSATRRVLVVEPVVRLAETEQRRRRDRRVVEPDDALEVRRRRRRNRPRPAARRPRPEQRQRRRRGSSGPGRFGSAAAAGAAARASSIGPDDTRLADDVRTVHPATAGLRARRDLRGGAAVDDPGRALQRRPDGRGRGRRPARRTTRGDRPIAGASSRTGRPRPRSARGCSTPGPRRSPRARRSGTRSCASAAWSRSIRSTSGSARARSASRIGSSGATGAPLALAGLWAGWRDPATRDGPADVHDHHHDPERGAGRPARPDAGGHRRRRLGSLAGSVALRPGRAARPAGPERGRSSSMSTRSSASSTMSGATARS